jgi:predicted negative regulator of RcsB-dependent stress response
MPAKTGNFVFLGVTNVYETDQEQIEAIKNWWNQNGNWVIGGFIVFIMSYVGYHWYQNSAEQHRFEASATYDELLLTITAESEDAQRRASLVSLLKDDYSDLGYATMAALIEAKAAVEADDLEKALTELDWALNNADKSLKTVILYRKAQVQYGLDRLDAALTTLASIEGEGHEAVTYELKGDILVEQGKKDEAREAFQIALDKSADQSINNPYLKVKLDDLAVAE